MPKTQNINLELTTDEQTKFIDWRRIMDGLGDGTIQSPYSNMQLIDLAVGDLINNKQDKLTAGAGITIVKTGNTTTISTDVIGIKYIVVQTLPVSGEAGTIYLVPSIDPEQQNVYDEYIYITQESKWEMVGSTKVDFSDYYNKAAVDALLALKQGLLIEGRNITIDPNTNTISADATEVIPNEQTTGQEAFLNELTIDGVKYRVAGVVNVDDTLSLESENPVQNKVITAALNNKQDEPGVNVDSTTQNIDYTFVDNFDKTFSYSPISEDITVRIPANIKHGTLSVVTFTNVQAEVTLNIVNGSNYPIRFINNNRVISTNNYIFGMTGRKIVFLRCDGQCAEILLIEEIAY